MSENFVAFFRRCVQVAPDEYAGKTETMICTRDTTIGEIEDWYLNIIRKDFPKTDISAISHLIGHIALEALLWDSKDTAAAEEVRER